MKELEVTQHLAKHYGFLTQVKCNAGCIDLLSNSSVIECKVDHRRWKEAVGQVFSYGAFFPEHEKEIWFFCDRNLKVEKQIKELGIVCVWFTNGLYGKQSCPLPPLKKKPSLPKPKPVLKR